MQVRYRIGIAAILHVAILLALPAFGQQPFFDRTHDSKVFGEARHYRILLPPAYETSGKRYPVIYYFHGHSDRYTVEKYDNGTDTIPKMAEWVAKHDAIVVCVDGYVASEYTGFYGGSPWDLLEKGGGRDFGPYFLELVQHIDSTYRTLTDRRHRATSGLSMGGFMSLYLSARYPDWIGSASAFNPGPSSTSARKAAGCCGVLRITSRITRTPWCGWCGRAATTSASITKKPAPRMRARRGRFRIPAGRIPPPLGHLDCRDLRFSRSRVRESRRSTTCPKPGVIPAPIGLSRSGDIGRT